MDSSNLITAVSLLLATVAMLRGWRRENRSDERERRRDDLEERDKRLQAIQAAHDECERDRERLRDAVAKAEEAQRRANDQLEQARTDRVEMLLLQGKLFAQIVQLKEDLEKA